MWQESISGASTGAQIGTQIMPGLGTAIGAVAGGITGGVFGKKARRRRKRAERLRKELEFQTNFRNRQAAIREWNAQQASILAMATASGAGIGSSAVKGASYGLYGSLQEELKFNALSFNMQRAIAKNQASAEKISGMFSAFSSGLQQGASAFGSRKIPPGPISNEQVFARGGDIARTSGPSAGDIVRNTRF